jgi:hypothetical protein
MGHKRNAYRTLVEKHEGKNQLEDRGVDGSTVFRWILKKQDERKRNGLFWLWTGTDGGHL